MRLAPSKRWLVMLSGLGAAACVPLPIATMGEGNKYDRGTPCAGVAIYSPMFHAMNGSGLPVLGSCDHIDWPDDKSSEKRDYVAPDKKDRFKKRPFVDVDVNKLAPKPKSYPKPILSRDSTVYKLQNLSTRKK